MGDTINTQLYDKALDTITELFNDTSVSQEQAQNNLEALITEIEIMIESLDA